MGTAEDLCVDDLIQVKCILKRMGGKHEDWLHLVQDTDKCQTLMKYNELLSSHSES